ncbi:MAG: hypothetical protein JXA77_01490, partial [Bacteroidales bacterium]|nr:hypothetical protein [Bacteroidales bacterium]
FIPERYGSIRIVFKNRGKSIGYKVFNVKNVPDPKIKIGKHELLKPLIYIPQTELLNADSLSVFVSYDIINSENWYSIKEYTFGYTYAVFYYSASNTGNKISSEIKEMIEKAGKDKLISINAIIESNSLIIKQLPIIKIVAY